jgi:hypothetical protein
MNFRPGEAARAGRGRNCPGQERPQVGHEEDRGPADRHQRGARLRIGFKQVTHHVFG